MSFCTGGWNRNNSYLNKFSSHELSIVRERMKKKKTDKGKKANKNMIQVLRYIGSLAA